MPQRRFDWHERIKAVEREYWSTRIAVDRLSAQVTHDPGILGSGPRPRDLGVCPRIRVRNPQVLASKQLASFEPN